MIKECIYLTIYLEEAQWRGLTSQQLEDIDLLFSDTIATNESLTLVNTQRLMSKSMNLSLSMNDKDIVLKVYKKVKYLKI